MAEIGVAAIFDRIIGQVFLAGKRESLMAVRSSLSEKFTQWSALNTDLDVKEFMLPLIVGKNGANILAWSEETKVSLQVNKRLLKLEIRGSSAELVAAAKTTLQDKIEGLLRQHWEVALDADAVGIVIGKQGVVINKIRQESGAHIEIDPATKIVKVLTVRSTRCSASKSSSICSRWMARRRRWLQRRMPSRVFCVTTRSRGRPSGRCRSPLQHIPPSWDRRAAPSAR